MSYVLDFSDWSAITPDWCKLAKQNGVIGVVVYIAPAAWGWPKAVTPARLKMLQDAGLDVAFGFEKDTADHLGGAATGKVDGDAIRVSFAELNLPNQSVFLSYDTDIPLSEFSLCAAYHTAALASSGHPLDAYAENALSEFLVSKGICKRGWMSESTGFPGNATPTLHTVLQQHYASPIPGLPGSYDKNTVTHDDWGQINAPANPQPIPVSGDNMILIPRRVASTVKGRDAWLRFDTPNKRFIGYNGVDFADGQGGWTIEHPGVNAYGITGTATLTVTANGTLDWGEKPDGTGVEIDAEGDGGTFGLLFKVFGPDPFMAVANPDIKAIAAAVAQHLTIATH